MARITWQNVDAPEFSDSINATAQVAQLLQAASSGVQGMSARNVDRIKGEKTNQVLDQLRQADDPTKVQIDPSVLNDLNPEAFDFVSQMLSSKNSAKNTELQGQTLDLNRERLASDIADRQLQRDKIAKEEKDALILEQILSGATAAPSAPPVASPGLSADGLGALGITDSAKTAAPLFGNSPTIDIPTVAPENDGMLGITNPGNNGQLLAPNAEGPDPLMVGIDDAGTEKYFRAQEETANQRKRLEAENARLEATRKTPGLGADALSTIRATIDTNNENIRRLGVDELNLSESAAQAARGLSENQGSIIASNAVSQFGSQSEAIRELEKREKAAPAAEKDMFRSAINSLNENAEAFTPSQEAIDDTVANGVFAVKDADGNPKSVSVRSLSRTMKNTGRIVETFGSENDLIVQAGSDYLKETKGMSETETVAWLNTKLTDAGVDSTMKQENLAYLQEAKYQSPHIPDNVIASVIASKAGEDVGGSYVPFQDSAAHNALEAIAGEGAFGINGSKANVDRKIKNAYELVDQRDEKIKTFTDLQTKLDKAVSKVAHLRSRGNTEGANKAAQELYALEQNIAAFSDSVQIPDGQDPRIKEIIDLSRQ